MAGKKKNVQIRHVYFIKNSIHIKMLHKSPLKEATRELSEIHSLHSVIPSLIPPYIIFTSVRIHYKILSQFSYIQGMGIVWDQHPASTISETISPAK